MIRTINSRWTMVKKQGPLVNFTMLVFLLTSIICSCKTGKEYQRPSVELPKQFRQVSFADTSSIADIAWKNFFTDTTLQNLINDGINHNQDLLVAIKQIDIAQARVKQAKVLQLPELNFQITGQYNRPSKNSLNGISTNSFLGQSHIENYQAIASLSWEVDVWGKLRRQNRLTGRDNLLRWCKLRLFHCLFEMQG